MQQKGSQGEVHFHFDQEANPQELMKGLKELIDGEIPVGWTTRRPKTIGVAEKTIYVKAGLGHLARTGQQQLPKRDGRVLP